MPITALDIVKARGAQAGKDGSISGAEFHRVGIPMFGGCQRCGASIAAYNAYPSVTGYLQCEGCIRKDGFKDVEDFEAFISPDDRGCED